MRETFVQMARRSLATHERPALLAYCEFVIMCHGNKPTRVPGMDTVMRLAIRIDQGRSIEEAAGREYFYRWNLALRSKTFGVPHTLGT